MAASSAQQSDASIVRVPEIAQAARSHPGEPVTRPLSAETMKMPDPIMEPTTRVVASRRPIPCSSWDCGFNLAFSGKNRQELTPDAEIPFRIRGLTRYPPFRKDAGETFGREARRSSYRWS